MQLNSVIKEFIFWSDSAVTEYSILFSVFASVKISIVLGIRYVHFTNGQVYPEDIILDHQEIAQVISVPCNFEKVRLCYELKSLPLISLYCFDQSVQECNAAGFGIRQLFKPVVYYNYAGFPLSFWRLSTIKRNESFVNLLLSLIGAVKFHYFAPTCLSWHKHYLSLNLGQLGPFLAKIRLGSLNGTLNNKIRKITKSFSKFLSKQKGNVSNGINHAPPLLYRRTTNRFSLLETIFNMV